VWAKEAIFPSERFTGAADRGVEMHSTGEVMTSGPTAAAAYRRALQAAGRGRPRAGIGAPLTSARDVSGLRVFEQLEPVLELRQP
jgi:hypothetical protein